MSEFRWWTSKGHTARYKGESYSKPDSFYFRSTIWQRRRRSNNTSRHVALLTGSPSYVTSLPVTLKGKLDLSA